MTENNHKIFNKILILLPFIDVITSDELRKKLEDVIPELKERSDKLY